MKKRNIVLISICIVVILLIYAVDLFKLNYRTKGWQEFGDSPITISHVQYFIADTPNIIGYTDHSLGREVSCQEAVAFVETDMQEKYRCCDTGGEISCLKGDFSSDIPPVDEECISTLKEVFGVTDGLPASREYQFFGNCSGGRFAELTTIQLAQDGKILWKHINVDSIQVVSTVLRCVVAPAILLFVLYILYGIYQEKTAAPVRRI